MLLTVPFPSLHPYTAGATTTRGPTGGPSASKSGCSADATVDATRVSMAGNDNYSCRVLRARVKHLSVEGANFYSLHVTIDAR